MNKSIIPNLFTASNLAFGVISLTFSAHGEFVYAAICVILSLIADACDGRVARALGVAGPMGRELDSLSDVVGFGVAPAYMLFAKEFGYIGWLGYVPLLVFAVCGAFRLARFNIMTEEVHGYFQGLPIPAAGVFAAAYVFSGYLAPTWILLLVMIVVGVLMVSNVKYPDFKGNSAILISKVALLVTAIVLVAGLVLLKWQAWLALVFGAYIIFGLVNSAMNLFVKA